MGSGQGASPGTPYRSEKPEQGTGDDPQRARLILVEEDDQVNQCLIHISSIVDRDLHVADQLEFRVRNLAYSEPSPWCESLREPFQPVPSLTIRPWSPSASQPEDRRTILLDSNLAFGTGRHPTTELCLKAIHELSCGPWGLSGRSVLDFGCGTALLAIAAVKLGASRGQGVEIDPDAAATAKRNVVLNGLTERIVISQGSWEAVERKVDLILANLVPSVLLRAGSGIPAHLNEQGRAIICRIRSEPVGRDGGFLCRSRTDGERAPPMQGMGRADHGRERRPATPRTLSFGFGPWSSLGFKRPAQAAPRAG